MPRDLPLSNGRLLVNFDSSYTLSDIYYPHVGTENHAYHCRSRLGVQSGSEFAWLDDEGWERSPRYAPDALVTQVEASNNRLQLGLTIEDAVDFARDVLVRRFTVRNLADTSRDVSLYLHLDVALGGNAVGDTVFFHPNHRALIAYKNVHYLLLCGGSEQRIGFDSWSAARKDAGSRADFGGGELDDVAIAFGSVDGIGELRLGAIAKGGTALAHAWLAAGGSLEDVEALQHGVLAGGPGHLIDRTRSYWQGWVAGPRDGAISGLPQSVKDLYRRSLLVARAQIDHDGAIIASPDSDIGGAYSPHGRSGPPITDLFRGHENYAYSWARDGALAAMALDDAGYPSLSREFLRFCTRVRTQRQNGDQAYMLQKHLANGAVASNVIAWIDEEGTPRLPIQEDETALVLIALRHHFARSGDWEFVASLYRSTVVGMANFLVDYRDPATGLPLPSQDLWEERQGVHAFTVATVWRALGDAAEVAELFAEPALAKRYALAAREMKAGAERHLYDEATGRFARSVRFDQDGHAERDLIVDASLSALAYFGMFDADDARIIETMATVEARLWVTGDHGGLARFEGDTYQLRQTAADAGVPGNPWPLCTLWLAQYQLMRARTPEDLRAPLRLLDHVARGALLSGVLAEQIDPATGEPAGATPLTWAHGTAIQTILEYVAASDRIEPPELESSSALGR